MTFGELFNTIRFQTNESDVQKVNNTIKGISSTAKRLLGVIGIGFSLTQLNAIAEEFDGIGDRIAYAAGEAENLDEIQSQILESANASRTALGEFANTVTKLKQSNADVFPIGDAAVFVEYVSKLGKAAGQSDGEINAMHNSIQRIIAKGKAAEADIALMLRQSPALAEQLAKGLGTDVDGLRAMAAQGRITASTLKTAILNSTDDIDAAFSNLNYGIGDMLVQVRNRFGVFVDETNKQFNITQSIAKFAYSMFDRLMGGLTRLRNGVQWLADRVGGIENLLRLLAISAGAVYTAMNAQRVIAFLKTATDFLRAGGVQMLKTVAIIVLIALIVEDFINFLQGNNSVIGELFDKAGIGADNARRFIVNAFTEVRQFLGAVLGRIRQFFDEHGAEIFDVLSRVWNAIFTVLSVVFGAIYKIASAIFGRLKSFWDEWGETILNVVGMVAGFVERTFGRIMEAIGLFADFIAAIFSGDIAGAVDALLGIFRLFFDQLRDLWNTLGSIIAEAWTGAEKFLSSLPARALQWGKDIILGLVNGIKSIKNRVGEAVSGVASKIKSLIGFSKPEDGPLNDFDTYMPDMIELMVKGIKGGKADVESAMQDIAGSVSEAGSSPLQTIRDGVRALVGIAKPSVSTVNSATTNNNVSKSVIQTNNFTNSFSGSDKENQRKAAKTMGKSANDVTSELARGLAYAL